MNAFKDILGGVGKAADAVFLGGAVTKNNRRNAFADLVSSGDYEGAQNFASRHGRFDLAQMAGQQGARRQQQQQAQLEAQKAEQAKQAQILGNIAAYGDSLPQEARLGYAQNIAPILQSQFGLDDDDVNDIIAAAQVPQGFGALAAAFIDPNQQVQNSFEDRRINETGRANVASERLRGGELGVSQGRLGLDRQKFGEDTRQFDATQGLEREKMAFQQQQAAAKNAPDPRALQQEELAFRDREQRVRLISDTFDKAIEQVGPMSAGVVGSKLDDDGGVFGIGAARRTFFGQGAANLRGTLDTLAANMGFEELQRMRDNSPTGGALGQVTERELKFLQSVLASIAQDQSPKQLKERLETAKQQIIQSWERVEAAREADLKTQAPQQALSQEEQAELDALRRELSGQ